jgi:CBS domain-containing protein
MRIQKTIGEFLGAKRSVPAVAPSDTVAEVVEVLKKHATDCALVCDAGRLLGVFTAWDLLSRVAAAELDATTTPVASVMTRDPETLSPDACITYAVNRMAHGGYRNIPIVDANGKPVGNLTVREVVSHLADVFAELDDVPDAPEWTDLGGGG